MAQKIKWTEEKIADMQKKGFGDGEGSSYIPWILVQHVGTSGVAHRAWSPKTGRKHHVLSDGEENVLYAAERCDSVTDIREQYPLERQLTLKIAEELSVRHPYYVGTSIPMVMTVDFLLTLNTDAGERLMAVNVKTEKDLETDSTIEKLEIQREYFRLLEIPHHLIVKSRMPPQEMKNVKSMRDAVVRPEEVGKFISRLPQLEQSMLAELRAKQSSKQRLNEYCDNFDAIYGLETGAGLRIAKILMSKRLIAPTLSSAEFTAEPIYSFFPATAQSSLQKVS